MMCVSSTYIICYTGLPIYPPIFSSLTKLSSKCVVYHSYFLEGTSFSFPALSVWGGWWGWPLPLLSLGTGCQLQCIWQSQWCPVYIYGEIILQVTAKIKNCAIIIIMVYHISNLHIYNLHVHSTCRFPWYHKVIAVCFDLAKDKSNFWYTYPESKAQFIHFVY